jgi:hypothetical protein
LQAQIDAAPPGSVVAAPAGCVFREMVTIAKPLTLVGGPGTEIRGSDIWTSWSRKGSYWASGTLPTMRSGGECRAGTSRCHWPEQVFLDGQPLRQVAERPSTGEFAVDAARNVVLADDPTGHRLEVTTRSHWVVIQADGVTIEHMTMRHAATAAQDGGIVSSGHSHLTVQDSVLSDAHGQAIVFTAGSDQRILRNDIYRNGNLGLGVSGTANTLVQGNTVHDNNTEDFEPGWSAGGAKFAETVGLTLDANVVDHNAGPGLWCDEGCSNTVFSHNRVHHNQNAGIMYEISDGAQVFGNVIWENGWGFREWVWGAGILISTSSNADVHDNVLAWNGDGISIVSQNRPSFPSGAEGDYVHDNLILSQDDPHDTVSHTALAFAADSSDRMFATSANNRGERNDFWYPAQESGATRFGWQRGFGTLSDFEASPAGVDGRYLSEPEKDRVVASTGIPPAQEPH